MTYEKRGKELLISGSKVQILAHPPIKSKTYSRVDQALGVP